MNLRWTVDAVDGVIVLSGEITEEADFAPLVNAASSTHAVIDLRQIAEINSCGVREWIHFMRDLDEAGRSIDLARCSPAMVRQLNMISNFAGSATIRSVMLPYYCEGCGHEESRELELTGSELPSFPLEADCPSCGEVLEFDDLPSSYLGFAHDLLHRGAA